MKLQDKLQHLKEEMEAKSQEYRDYCNRVKSYSVFNIKALGNTLAEIITIFEGTPYSCQIVALENSCSNNDFGGPKDIKSVVERLALVNQSDENERILLPNGTPALYSIDRFGIFSEITYLSNRFPYIRDFVDYVIFYKMENGVEEIEEEALEELKESFLKAHKEQKEVKRKNIQHIQ